MWDKFAGGVPRGCARAAFAGRALAVFFSSFTISFSLSLSTTEPHTFACVCVCVSPRGQPSGTLVGGNRGRT